MKVRLLMWILWPAFIVAGAADGLLFTLIDPEDLHFFGGHVQISREGAYTIGFFAFWVICSLSSALSLYLIPEMLSNLKEDRANSLI